MATLLYSVSMSLDGFIAGAGGDMSWLAGHFGPNPVADELPSQVGAFLCGNTMFGGDDPNRGDPEKEGAFGGAWDGPVVVLTHRPPADDVPGVRFATDLPTAIAEAKAAAGDKYVCVGGANVAKQCLDAGELDEVLTIIVPMLLGDGTRLFEQPGGRPVRLDKFHVSDSPSGTNVWLRVVR